MLLSTEIIKGCVNAKAIVHGQGFQQVEIVNAAPVPAADGTFGQGQLRVLHNTVLVEKLFGTQAVTGGAGPGRVVKREQARLQLVQAVTALWTGKP